MSVRSGKAVVADLLSQEGVTLLFGNPGTTELPLLDALRDRSTLRYILSLQEAAVMAMADGFAQASGHLAAVSLHLAGGLGNAMGMLQNAWAAGSPVLVTAGQYDPGSGLTEPTMAADLPALARPLVKWAAEVRRFADLPRAVHRAAKTALAPPTGPVFLSLPVDVLAAEGELALREPSRVAPGFGADPTAIRAAADVVRGAARPVIVAGDVVAQRDALAELAALADLIGAPIYTEPVGARPVVPAVHPLFAGALPHPGPDVRERLGNFDVLLGVGADLLTLTLPSAVDPLPDQLAVVHLHVDPWELAKNYPARVALLGDPKTTLPELTAAIAERMTPEDRADAQARVHAWRDTLSGELGALRRTATESAHSQPIQPLALMRAVGEMLPADAVVVDESISSRGSLQRLLRTSDARGFFGLRGGAIGWGLPAAIGIKLALPHRPVVALVGDGSALYTIQALWTAAHEGVAASFVILNNGSYRILKQRHSALGLSGPGPGGLIGLDLTEPTIDFVRLAEAFGLEACRTLTVADACAAIRHAVSANVPTLIDVVLDGSV
jgi:benzoylformate decarboxylase